MCPFVWVGTVTSCLRFSVSRSCNNSVVYWLVGELTWILKSPRIATLFDVVHTDKSSSVNSEMKCGCGLGGRYMRMVVSGMGFSHVKAKHSNDDSFGNVTEDRCRSER